MVGVFFKILGVHAQQGAVVFLIIRKFGNDAAGLIPQAARHGNVPFLDEPFDQPSPLDAAQRRDKDAGPGIRGSDGNDGEFQRIGPPGSRRHHFKMRIFGNLLFHSGCNALPEVLRQAAQGIKPLCGIRPYIHVLRIHRNNGHHDFFAIHAVHPVIPDFFIIGIPVRVKGNMGILIFYLMSDKSCLGNMFEIIGTRHYRHAAEQHESHQGS